MNQWELLGLALGWVAVCLMAVAAVILILITVSLFMELIQGRATRKNGGKPRE